MKISETLLSIVFIILLLFNGSRTNSVPTTESNDNVIQTVENYEIYYNYDGKPTDETLKDLFKDTSLFKDGALDCDYLLNNSSILENKFELPYSDVAYVITESVKFKSKVNIDGYINKITVKGNSTNVDISLNVLLNLHKKNFFTQILGIRNNELTIGISICVDLEQQIITTDFNSKDINLTDFCKKIGSNYIFGTKDYQSVIDEIAHSVIYGLGRVTSFEKDALSYN